LSFHRSVTSGTLILLYGVGAIGGPFTSGALMGWFGPSAYWAYLAVVYAAIGLFALYRMTRRPARPRAEVETAAPSVANITLDQPGS
jgi:hypothetical protein